MRGYENLRYCGEEGVSPDQNILDVNNFNFNTNSS